MVSTDLNETPPNWFYIRSVATGKVITCVSGPDLLLSQVYVCPYEQTDTALWTWDGSFLRNKANDLVLDIRQGRLRMMEDTEICLYTKKPLDDAHNQLWGCKDVVDELGRKQKGNFIYSIRNEEWVLDIGQIDEKNGNNSKLILFPSQTIENGNQRWILEPASETASSSQHISSASAPSASHHAINIGDSHTAYPAHMDAQSYHEFSFSSSRSSSSADLAGMNFPYGLMPAKRGSQSSVSASSLSTYNEYHNAIYVQKVPHLSDKVVAMAAAYETWQTWKKDEQTNLLMNDSSLSLKERQDKLRAVLLSLARTEATRLLEDTNNSGNATHQQSVLSLTSRYILQLYEQLPSTP